MMDYLGASGAVTVWRDTNSVNQSTKALRGGHSLCREAVHLDLLGSLG